MSAYHSLRETSGPTTFVGYDRLRAEARVVGLVAGESPVEAAGSGDEVEVLLDRTPFFGEAGGQVGDTGRLTFDGGAADVLDTRRALPDLHAHRVRVVSGELRVGAPGFAEVDVERRRAVSRAHTATHLVHQALRRALGDEAAQAGSLNAPGRLRFDFASPSAVPPSVLADVEDEVNAQLAADLEVRAFVTSPDEARRMGAVALFDEAYGDAVRVVEVGDYSRELCAGTHTPRSGHIGLVKLLGESSIAAGVRRVEALVGLDAFRYLAREHILLSRVGDVLKAQPEELPDRVAAVVQRLRDAERELDRLRADTVLQAAPGLAEEADDVAGVAVVTTEAAPGTSVEDARRLAIDVRDRIEPHRPAVVAIAIRGEGRAQLVLAVGPAAQARGLRAGELVREPAGLLGGGGGGRDDYATAGGSDPDGVPGALDAVRRLVAQSAR